MILYLVQILNFDFPGINLFTYLSFRAGCAIITSLLIVLLIGPKFIKSMLIKQGNGQPIREDGPKSHLHSKKGTPSMGGLLILSSFLISTLIWGDIFNSFIWIVILSTILFGLIGYIDDRKKIKDQNPKGISSKNKFLLQILSSFILIFLISLQSSSELVYSISIPFVNGVFFLGLILYYCFTSFVIVGTSNAVNLTDGLDGLAIVPIMIAIASFGLITYLSGNLVFSEYLGINYIPYSGELSILCCALLGSCLGFLWFNAPPAMIFMGDTGSLSLGAILGSIAVITKHELVLIVIGGIFVLEAMSVIIQVFSYRVFGKRVFKMAPIHHHFEKKGWSESTIVIRFWIISFVLAIIGLATLKIR